MLSLRLLLTSDPGLSEERTRGSSEIGKTVASGWFRGASGHGSTVCDLVLRGGDPEPRNFSAYACGLLVGLFERKTPSSRALAISRRALRPGQELVAQKWYRRVRRRSS